MITSATPTKGSHSTAYTRKKWMLRNGSNGKFCHDSYGNLATDQTDQNGYCTMDLAEIGRRIQRIQQIQMDIVDR